MQLKVDNQPQDFITIQTFRERWNLPDSFQIALFETKEEEGLGSLEGAGPMLAAARQRVMAVVPDHLEVEGLPLIADELTRVFRHELESANAHIGLRSAEVEFAVSGFYDVLQGTVYRLIELAHGSRGDLAQLRGQFDFSTIYQAWLDDSVRVSTLIHSYAHDDVQFQIRVIYYIYGRMGLEVEIAGKSYYVLDPRLACPAAGFMYELCAEVAQALCSALNR